MAKRKIKNVDVDDNYDDLKLQIQEPINEEAEEVKQSDVWVKQPEPVKRENE